MWQQWPWTSVFLGWKNVIRYSKSARECTVYRLCVNRAHLRDAAVAAVHGWCPLDVTEIQELRDG